jgi:hypothetical protein
LLLQQILPYSIQKYIWPRIYLSIWRFDPLMNMMLSFYTTGISHDVRRLWLFHVSAQRTTQVLLVGCCYCCGGGCSGTEAAGINLHSIKITRASPLTMYLHFLSYHHVLVPGVHTWKSFRNSAYKKTQLQLDAKYLNIPTVIKFKFRNTYVQPDR